MPETDPLEVVASWTARIVAFIFLGALLARRILSVVKATATQIERMLRRLYE
jgi:hypothetical protein